MAFPSDRHRPSEHAVTQTKFSKTVSKCIGDGCEILIHAGFNPFGQFLEAQGEAGQQIISCNGIVATLNDHAAQLRRLFDCETIRWQQLANGANRCSNGLMETADFFESRLLARYCP